MVVLDFGADVFTGQARWLKIQVCRPTVICTRWRRGTHASNSPRLRTRSAPSTASAALTRSTWTREGTSASGRNRRSFCKHVHATEGDMGLASQDAHSEGPLAVALQGTCRRLSSAASSRDDRAAADIGLSSYGRPSLRLT